MPSSGVALAAAFAVGTQFRSPAPDTAAPKAEREFSLRLDHDAQGFAERVRARR
jgi:hypothetical protein